MREKSLTFLQGLIKFSVGASVAACITIPFTNSAIGWVSSERIPFTEKKLSTKFLLGTDRAITNLGLPYDLIENIVLSNYYVTGRFIIGGALAIGPDITEPEGFNPRFKNIP